MRLATTSDCYLETLVTEKGGIRTYERRVRSGQNTVQLTDLGAFLVVDSTEGLIKE
jgi:hypothetical protein